MVWSSISNTAAADRKFSRGSIIAIERSHSRRRLSSTEPAEEELLSFFFSSFSTVVLFYTSTAIESLIINQLANGSLSSAGFLRQQYHFIDRRYFQQHWAIVSGSVSLVCFIARSSRL